MCHFKILIFRLILLEFKTRDTSFYKNILFLRENYNKRISGWINKPFLTSYFNFRLHWFINRQDEEISHSYTFPTSPLIYLLCISNIIFTYQSITKFSFFFETILYIVYNFLYKVIDKQIVMLAFLFLNLIFIIYFTFNQDMLLCLWSLISFMPMKVFVLFLLRNNFNKYKILRF